MNFGYFDDDRREYVITNPDTPEPWSNYLGSTEYGAIITNNAGGYSFYKSAAEGRFMRYRTNAIPMDQPGRYIYIHDKENKDYWSASWQPVAKSIEKFKSECRHGTAYSVISSEYASIKSETTYFVPLGKTFECWHCRIINTSKEKRSLRLFTFVEYSSHWHMYHDLINMQYSQYILTMDVVDNIIDQGINTFLDESNGGQARHSFIGIANAEVTGFDTDRKKFLGYHRGYTNPVVVEQGECTNSVALGDNGCGTLQTDVELAPGEVKEFVVVMGIGKASEEGKKAIQFCSDINRVKSEFEKLKNHWHKRLNNMVVKTPNDLFNSMVNMWNPYNCLLTYAWSRAASLVYAGERDGLGYRDSVQDLLGVLHTIPEEAGKRLELMITGQVSTGGSMPVVKQFSHHPGQEKAPEEEEYRSDDCMWLFNTIPAYVKETGDISFFSKILPYADKGEDTVLNHLKRAIEFTLLRSGAHGLPCGLLADWNDCLMLGQKGESVFVAFQLRYALNTYIEICELLNEQKETQWAKYELQELDENLEKHAWDGDYFLRAFRDDGLKYGTNEDKEGSIWLNPQTWSVYSGHAKGEKAIKIMDVVNKRLATDYGLMICDPPYEKADVNVIKATLFDKGMKENGAIFCHTQGWAIIAEAINGNGTRAHQYFNSFMPASFNNLAEIREIEPYVYSQSIHSKYSPRFGASRLPWLTGAAAWAYYSAIQYILGIQPCYGGIRIDPCIPKEWNHIKITRIFKNKTLNIEIHNPNKSEKGIRKIILNGEELKNDIIPDTLLKDINIIEAYMK